MFYSITILVCMTIIAIIATPIGMVAYSLSWWYTVLAVVASTVAVIAIDGLFAFLIRRFPEKWFSIDNARFDTSKRECKIWEKFGVRKMRELVPDLGVFTNFRKNKVYEPNDNNYLARYVLELNYGVVIHIVGMFLGFLIIFIFPLKYCLFIGLPVAVVNFVLNFMPTIVLRYNQPRLKKLYCFNLKRKEREKTTETTEENT